MEHVSRSTKPVPPQRPPAGASDGPRTGARASSPEPLAAASRARGPSASSTWWGVDLRLCITDAGEIRLPQADARYDVVYSLRTLAHLGHDEASSDLGVRSLLAEAARVTVPGGVVLVDINNPTSLRGLFYGIRRPITLVASGKVVHADARHHVTRHDTLARLLRVAPPVLDTIAVYGVRVLVPIARALQIPVLGRILASLEWWARDSFLRGFGAHLLVVLRKDEDADRAASNRK